METFLQHICAWMSNVVKDSKMRMQNIVQEKIQAFDMWIDSFKLGMLEQPRNAPSIYITGFVTKIDTQCLTYMH